MLVSLDGGVTYSEAPEGVRVIHDLEFVPGEDGPGSLHLNLTVEGMISDVWTETTNIATKSQSFDEMTQEMIDQDS